MRGYLEAETAYQKSIEYLKEIQGISITGYSNSFDVFYERIYPVYIGLVDILLQRAAESDAIEKEELLNRARDKMEELKVTELRNYFQNECENITKNSCEKVDISKYQHTAILYPILLNERIELLLNLPDGIHQYFVKTKDFKFEKLEETVRKFRDSLQDLEYEKRFIKPARKLYDWLISPILPTLKENGIKTLIIVPDGPLRTIPMAALLNEEKKFLIQEFALATLPSLNLTQVQAWNKENTNILLNGLSERTEQFPEFPELSYVNNEIENIGNFYKNNSTRLLNQTFSSNEVENNLKNQQYDIIHIASHSEFNRNPNRTFLLTYSEKLSMNRLEQFIAVKEQPLELLTLSACKTAEGDERAALGLAGVAIKAGAKSALASLWSVNDESTMELITEFYDQLKNPKLSKSQALQNAQKKMINNKRFQHPYFWSAFLLIGNWL